MLAFHRDKIVLVRESYPTWGGSFWNVPSGAVEDGESPAEGAARELAEETGLAILSADLSPVSEVLTVSGAQQTRAWNYTAHIDELDEPSLQSDDPDELIEEVRWFALSAAIEELERLPYEPLRVPAVAYLRGGSSVGSPRAWSFNV